MYFVGNFSVHTYCVPNWQIKIYIYIYIYIWTNVSIYARIYIYIYIYIYYIYIYINKHVFTYCLVYAGVYHQYICLYICTDDKNMSFAFLKSISQLYQSYHLTRIERKMETNQKQKERKMPTKSKKKKKNVHRINFTEKYKSKLFRLWFLFSSLFVTEQSIRLRKFVLNQRKFSHEVFILPNQSVDIENFLKQ